MLMEIVGKIGFSEVVLLFLLIFVLPVTALLLLRLRKYEALFGELPEEKKSGKKKKKKAKEKEPEPQPESPRAEHSGAVAFRSRPFLTPEDRACLAAMRQALGPEVEVYPKVALWETVEPVERDAESAKRLQGKCLDFLVCDKQTGKALTAVMFNPGKGRPAGGIDEIRTICGIAGASVVFIDMAEKYDAKSLKKALGIPELDI